MCNFILEEEYVCNKGESGLKNPPTWLQYIRGVTNHINSTIFEMIMRLAEIGGLSS